MCSQVKGKTYRLISAGMKDNVVRIDDITLSLMPSEVDNTSAFVATALLALWQQIGNGKIIVRPGDAAHQIAEMFNTSPAAAARIAAAWWAGKRT